MTTVPKDDFRPLPYLVSLGAVAAATIGVFFGIGFLWLTPPHPAGPSAAPVAPAQALEGREVSPPGNNDAAQGSSNAPADKVAASPTPDAPSSREALALRPTTVETTLTPPAGVVHRKEVGAGRRRHQGTGRHWTALWRPNVSVGPNPGGGFYGPPNVNIGRINP